MTFQPSQAGAVPALFGQAGAVPALFGQACAVPALFGQEGELVLLRVAVEPRLLEDLLDALAHLDFPVNPQLYHRPAQVTVEFPAYSARVNEVRDKLQRHGFSPADLDVARGLELAGA